MNVNKVICDAILKGTPLEGEQRTEHIVENGEIIEIEVYPNYTSPIAYRELMDWMREDGRWWEFDKWNRFECQNTIMSFLSLETSDQVALIAAAIEQGGV